MTPKIYRLQKTHPRRGESTHEGSLEQLSHYFGISPIPKTIKSLVDKVQEKYDWREGCCYDRTHVEVE